MSREDDAMNIEFVGGPADGYQVGIADGVMDMLAGPNLIPEEIKADAGRVVGYYVKTRKLTKDGRLIFEFRRLVDR
jgi:hypothetical protein